MIDIEVKHPTLQFTKEEVEEILRQYNRTLNNVQMDIDTIKNWFKTQPHLTQIPDDRLILNLLILNKFSIEKMKIKLDYYYSIRGMIPEVYSYCVPSDKNIIALRNTSLCFTLPKLVNLNRVVFFVFHSIKEKINGYQSLAKTIMDAEALLYRDIYNGLEVVVDYSQTNLTFWLSFTPVMAKIIINVSEKVFCNRLRTVRVVGLPQFANTLITYGLSLLPKKIKERITFHKDLNEIAQYYEKELLPVEFGGVGRSYREMAADFDGMVDKCEEYFQNLKNFQVDERLRPMKLDNDEILGFHGNFRKLEVD